MDEYYVANKPSGALIMNIEFTVQVIAPDEELQLAGECYAIYRRRLRLDFLPPLAAVISLSSNLEEKDSRASNYRELVGIVDNKDCCFIIKDVFLEIGCDDVVAMRLRAQDIFESSILRFRKFGELLTQFYQFDRII